MKKLIVTFVDGNREEFAVPDSFEGQMDDEHVACHWRRPDDDASQPVDFTPGTPSEDAARLRTFHLRMRDVRTLAVYDADGDEHGS